MKTVIRKTWPRIRLVSIKGQEFYLVDCRKQGTSGKKEHFSSRSQAEKRAREVAGEMDSQGKEGFSITYEMRSVLMTAEEKLKPWGKSLLDAVNHYVAYLQDEEVKSGSKLIKDLSYKWYLDRKNDVFKPLRQDTLDGILEINNRLSQNFGNTKIAELTKERVVEYLKTLDVSNRRRFNIKSGMSQFFNWCIKNKYVTTNPLNDIVINVEEKEVEIFEVSEITRIFKKLQETEWKPLLPYFAICTYAGLRPTEAELLKWENVHLEERQISVLADTSKNKEARNVIIEDKLFKILSEYDGEKTGMIIKKSPRCYIERFKIALGYKVNGKNPNGKKWIADGLRHTFASYHIGKYSNRGVLAEQMGNSLKMIKDHYKKVVKTSDVLTFWSTTETEQPK